MYVMNYQLVETDFIKSIRQKFEQFQNNILDMMKVEDEKYRKKRLKPSKYYKEHVILCERVQDHSEGNQMMAVGWEQGRQFIKNKRIKRRDQLEERLRKFEKGKINQIAYGMVEEKIVQSEGIPPFHQLTEQKEIDVKIDMHLKKSLRETGLIKSYYQGKKFVVGIRDGTKLLEIFIEVTPDEHLIYQLNIEQMVLVQVWRSYLEGFLKYKGNYKQLPNCKNNHCHHMQKVSVIGSVVKPLGEMEGVQKDEKTYKYMFQILDKEEEILIVVPDKCNAFDGGLKLTIVKEWQIRVKVRKIIEMLTSIYFK